MNQNIKRQELEKRLKTFSLRVLGFIKSLPKTEENRIYGKQIIRSSSSIGANYAEAVYAHTKPDFVHNLNICRKESNETLYWLEMLYETNYSFQPRMAELLDENKQILKIFISSVKTAKENKNDK